PAPIRAPPTHRPGRSRCEDADDSRAGLRWAAAAHGGRPQPRVVGAQADRVGHDLERREAGARERAEPLLGGEKPGRRARRGVEDDVREARQELEGELDADRLAAARPEGLADHEPAARGERRTRLGENGVEIAREVEHVHAPHEPYAARRHTLGGPRLVQVEGGEGERHARAHGAQRALGAAAEERHRRGYEVGGGRAERAALVERVEQCLGRAPEPGAHLEHGAARRAGGGGRRRHAVVERVVAALVAEVGDPERQPAEERALAVGLPARRARVESRRLVEEGEGRGVRGVRREAFGTERLQIRRRERAGQPVAAVRLALRHAGEGEPFEEPAQRGREAWDEATRGEDLLDRARLGEERYQLEPRHDVDRELERIVLDQLAAPVLARVEERVAEARLREELVEARIDGRGDEGRHHAGGSGARVTAPRRRRAPASSRTWTRQRQKCSTRRSRRAAKRSGPACVAAWTRTSRYSATTARDERPRGRRPAASPAACAAPSSSAGQGQG